MIQCVDRCNKNGVIDLHAVYIEIYGFADFCIGNYLFLQDLPFINFDEKILAETFFIS